MANFNFNKFIFGGRLTADPELKTTQNGKSVTSFSVAINDGYGENKTTDFFPCVAWNKTAEYICKYFRKGSSIAGIGELRNRSFDDRNGNKRTVTEINVNEVKIVDSKSEVSDYTADAEEISSDDPNFVDVGNDDDCPFD